MEWEKYLSEKLARKFILRYAVLCFLIVFWTFQQERKKILYSLKK